jgi:hypothetical protein
MKNMCQKSASKILILPNCNAQALEWPLAMEFMYAQFWWITLMREWGTPLVIRCDPFLWHIQPATLAELLE